MAWVLLVYFASQTASGAGREFVEVAVHGMFWKFIVPGEK